MKIHWSSFLIIATVMIGAPALAFADVVTNWNVAALHVIRDARVAPPIASRALAMMHVAVFDAVNGIDRTYEPYLVRGNVPRSASREAAASAAAHDVLVSVFPNYSAHFDDVHRAQLGALGHGPQLTKGLEWGATVSRRIVAARAADNSDAAVAPPSLTGPGFWQATPPAFSEYLLPQWGYVTPFGIPTSSSFRPTGPPPLDSAAYAADFNEIKNYGAAAGSLRTPEQSQIALFWADGAGTETPPGHWNTIARTVALDRGNTLEQNARLFALLNIAMADAAICAWDAKYFYDFWRPVTAIRNADADGNAATDADPTWSSFITTPPFPDYLSGHSTFSGAAESVLATFFGTDGIAFDSPSDFLPGIMRHFESFSSAASQAAISRLYGGIHFRSANEDGRAAGRAIGEWIVAGLLQPKGNHSR